MNFTFHFFHYPYILTDKYYEGDKYTIIYIGKNRYIVNIRQSILKGQSKKDNPEKLSTQDNCIQNY